MVTHKGALLLARCHASAAREGLRASSKGHRPHRKINVTSKPPAGDISVVTLIRTDTTLDHSQKAEKVCLHEGLLARRLPASQAKRVFAGLSG